MMRGLLGTVCSTSHCPHLCLCHGLVDTIFRHFNGLSQVECKPCHWHRSGARVGCIRVQDGSGGRILQLVTALAIASVGAPATAASRGHASSAHVEVVRGGGGCCRGRAGSSSAATLPAGSVEAAHGTGCTQGCGGGGRLAAEQRVAPKAGTVACWRWVVVVW